MPELMGVGGSGKAKQAKQAKPLLIKELVAPIFVRRWPQNILEKAKNATENTANTIIRPCLLAKIANKESLSA